MLTIVVFKMKYRTYSNKCRGTYSEIRDFVAALIQKFDDYLKYCFIPIQFLLFFNFVVLILWIPLESAVNYYFGNCCLLKVSSLTH